MKKDLGVKPFLFPMPVLMIATYNEDGTVDVMNMAWGGICDHDKVALNLEESHKTVANLKARRAFTLSVADVAHVEQADYFGLVSANNVKDKFERSGLHAVKSTRVDAPIVEEFPLTLECEVHEIQPDGFRVVGKIVNVQADTSILTSKGAVDVTLLQALMFDQFQGGYYKIGDKVGQAWKSGKPLAK